MSVSTLNGSSENPQPIKVERKMQNIKMGKDTRHKPPKLPATNLSILEEWRDVYLGPPGNRYRNHQNSNANNNGVFWNFGPFGGSGHNQSHACLSWNSRNVDTSASSFREYFQVIRVVPRDN